MPTLNRPAAAPAATIGIGIAPMTSTTSCPASMRVTIAGTATRARDRPSSPDERDRSNMAASNSCTRRWSSAVIGVPIAASASSTLRPEVSSLLSCL
jgi:hypothetical protein